MNILHRSIFVTGALAVSIAGCNAQTNASLQPNMQKAVTEIRAESTRPNNDSAGHALPLLASWNTGTYADVRGLDPAYQIGLIEQGHHLLLSFAFPNLNGGQEAARKQEDYYKAAMQRAAALNLPITLVSTQWEQQLTLDQKYFDLPPDQNPNVVTPDGEVLKKLSPFGPVELWHEIGAKWAASPLMKQLQQWYPNPPLVVLLSNNEAGKLRWQDVETDARFVQKYGKNRDDNFKRKVVADGWIERYRAMQQGMRDALIANAWRDTVIFEGYDAFGPPFMGRWGGWTTYSQHSPGRFDPNPLMWDGGSPSYYTNDWDAGTDFRVQSPQIESMNWVFMQKQALQLNPNFRFDFSIWDGQEFNSKRSEKYQSKPDYYRSLGQTYGPARYAGYAQFGLWLLRPRVLREYRGWQSDLKSMEPYFLALAGDVDRVYQNDTLKYFWRKGELVPNRTHQHPYQSAIPDASKSVDRWFLLDTNLDPPRPWKLDTEIPVFSLALATGENGNRRWLVYAHSPLQDRQNVEIALPDYGKITVDVPVAGAFYEVGEKTRKIQKVS